MREDDAARARSSPIGPLDVVTHLSKLGLRLCESVQREVSVFDYVNTQLQYNSGFEA